MRSFDAQQTESFPKDNIPTKEKGKKWHLQAAKAIYSEYTDSALAQHQANIPLLRAYAKGRQPISKYMGILGIKDKTKSYHNLNWENLKIGVKYTELAVGMLMKYKLRPNCTSIDPLSIDTKIQHEYFIRAMGFMSQNTSSPVLQQLSAGLPAGDYEIKRYMQSDYKQAIEMDMEKGISMVMLRNDHNEIEKRAKRDLVVTGMCGTKTYVDSSGMVKERKVNPETLVLPPHALPNARDARYIGERRYLTIADLKMLDVRNEITSREWDDIIHNHTGASNSFFHAGVRSTHSSVYDEYDSHRVEVLDFEYMSYDALVHERKETRFGTVNMNERDVNYKPSKKSKYKREKVQSDYKCWYKGLWIVGTDYILDYGKCDYQVRGNEAEGKLAEAQPSFSIYVMSLDEGDTKPVSLVERMIPHIDDMQLTWLKMQNTKAKSRPKGYAIDVDQLAAVAARLGMNPNDTMEVLNWMDATGHTAYSSMANARLYENGYLNQQKPVEEQDNGLPSNYQLLVNDLFTAIRMIQEVTGINEAVDASNVDPGRPVKTSQMAAMAAGTAMATILDAWKNIFLNTSVCIAKKLQQVVSEKGPISGYIEALGEGTMMSFRLSKEIAFAEFSLVVTEQPNEDEIQVLQNWIVRALDMRTTQGKGGLDLGTAMRAYRMSKYDLRSAEAFLIQQLERQQAIDREQELENIRLNAQSQQQSAMMAQQGRNQEQQTKLQGDIAKLDKQGSDKLEQIRLQKGMEGVNQLFAKNNSQ
jgi:hypothetical protein